MIMVNYNDNDIICINFLEVRYMEEKDLLILTDLAESIEDLDYIEDIDLDEGIFILKEATGAIKPIEKFNFLIELKKLNAAYEDEEKQDHYFSAFMEAKKVVLKGDREVFRDFVSVATNPRNFDRPYNDYYDSLMRVEYGAHEVLLEEKSSKVKTK